MNCFRSGLLLPIFLLAGCEMTVAVTGMLGDSEALSGSLTHYDDGGTIELYGARGTHCAGNFLYQRSRTSRSDGSGTLTCDAPVRTFHLRAPRRPTWQRLRHAQRSALSLQLLTRKGRQ